MIRRAILAVVFLLFGGGAHAQYPERAVRILVGYPPGGGTDLVARLIAQPLAEKWRQPVVVENRPGANAILATDAVAKARPDGYTLLMAYATELALNPATHKSLPYDPLRDLAPILQLGSAPLVLAVHPSVPAQDLRAFVALLKSKPGALSYSSSGTGSVHHFAGELFKLETGTDMLHVPYKGSGPAVADAVSGQVQATFASRASVLRFIQAGRLRSLGETELTSWYGLLAPAGTPAQLVRRIAEDAAAVAGSPETQKGFLTQGMDPVQSSPAAFAAFMRAEAAKFARIARAAGIQPE